MILDKEITILCALRYALGRKTYVVSAVINTIINDWRYLSQNSQSVIMEEITEAIEKNLAGNEADITDWKRITSYLTIKEEEEKC